MSTLRTGTRPRAARGRDDPLGRPIDEAGASTASEIEDEDGIAVGTNFEPEIAREAIPNSSRYDIAMIIESHWQGLPTLLIDTPLARCEIGLQGAQVLSFIPAHDGRDLLWCSPARLQPGRPVRGGIPICWPWFSRQGQTPAAVQHGFARRLPWALRQAQEAADGSVRVTLELMAPPIEKPNGGLKERGAPQTAWPQTDWPASCTAELHLEISAALTVRLISRNDSDTPLRLTQALHTYLRVGDVHHTALHGLQGRDYLDNLQGLTRFTQHVPWHFDQACDRIYLETAAEHVLEDPLLRRSIRIRSQGSGSTVVWNAGAPGYAALGDVPAHAWPGYLCVEAANCEPHDPVLLAPGARTELVQTLALD